MLFGWEGNCRPDRKYWQLIAVFVTNNNKKKKKKKIYNAHIIKH